MAAQIGTDIPIVSEEKITRAEARLLLALALAFSAGVLAPEAETLAAAPSSSSAARDRDCWPPEAADPAA